MQLKNNGLGGRKFLKDISKMINILLLNVRSCSPHFYSNGRPVVSIAKNSALVIKTFRMVLELKRIGVYKHIFVCMV